MATIEKEIRRALIKSVPIAMVVSADQIAAVSSIQTGINGKYPLIVWDIVNGARGFNKLGKLALIMMVKGAKAAEAVANKSDADVDTTYKDAIKDIQKDTGRPVDMVEKALRLPQDSIVIMQNAHRYFGPNIQGSAAFAQAILNLRDPFKSTVNAWKCAPDEGTRLLVLMAPEEDPLPTEIAAHVLMIDDPLPTEEERKEIILNIYQSTEVPDPDNKNKTKLLPPPDEDTLRQALDATLGLPPFVIEQILALSMTPEGLDMKELSAKQIRTINQAPGITVWPGKETLADIGGNENAVNFFRKLNRGRKKPGFYWYVDEIEKGVSGTGAAGGGDTSGVSQGMLGELLKEIVDGNIFFVLLLGLGGTGKSLLAKSLANDAKVKCLALELQACKSSLVGESIKNIRNAFKIGRSFAPRDTVMLATCNRIEDLPPELLSRAAITFFFDIPERDEKDKIWDIQIKNFGLAAKQARPNDEGYVGRDIFNVCRNASILDISLEDAAEYIAAAERTSATRIEELRTLAETRGLIGASRGGPYKRIDRSQQEIKTSGRRKITSSVGD